MKSQNNLNKSKVENCLAAVRSKYNIQGRFTQADFYRICEAEKIRLLNCEIGRSLADVKALRGMVLTFPDFPRNYVYLRSFFNRSRRLCMTVAMHELGHYFLKHPGTALKSIGNYSPSERKREREADYFAELATKII